MFGNQTGKKNSRGGIRGFRSIKTRILVMVLSLVCGLLLVMGGATICLNYLSTSSALEASMTSIAQVAAERIHQELAGYEELVQSIGLAPVLCDATTSATEKFVYLEEKSDQFGFAGSNMLHANGVTIGSSQLDLSGRDYFKAAIQGQTSVSEPLVNAETGETTIVVAAPVWENGEMNSTVVGVVMFELPSMLDDISKSIQISPNCAAYINNAEGTTIGSSLEDQATTEEHNTIEAAKTDKRLAKLAALEQKMCDRETGFGVYTDRGIGKFLAYAPIDGTSWSIGVSAPVTDFMDMMRMSMVITIVLLAVGILLASLLAASLTRKIAAPIRTCAKRLELLAEGDLKTPVPVIQAQDETGILAAATEKIVQNINQIIADLGQELRALAQGDLTARAAVPYVGDFAALQTSLSSVFQDLNRTLAAISDASAQVATGAGQISTGAQALSQGASQQASSVAELSQSINEISGQIQDSANDARTVEELSAKAGQEIAQGNQYMQDMVQAMERITSTSNEIGKIIKTIDDIAFQTNILALNAAIEAARAGEAGKGFSVVAEQVRELAQKSAEAASNTTTLIEDTQAAVEKGTGIADKTAKSLTQIVENEKGVNDRVQKIAEAMQKQSEEVHQITAEIDQISSVVQVNSETSEESAAASEELSAQAQTLQSAVGKFQLDTDR